ncbi:uncharacterized protein PODANS_6_940, partial [Podospora anserina S mat+]
GKKGEKADEGTNRQADFIPPRKPYGFLAMLDDILQFAAQTLVDNGRVAFWMPTANDEEQEMPVPSHPYLETLSVSTQVFNKWSRRLICYRRIPDKDVDSAAVKAREERKLVGKTADELNPFRKAYFEGFQTPPATTGTSTPAAPATETPPPN